MQNRVIHLLNKLEKYLADLGHPCLHYLQEGLSVQDIQQQLSVLSLKANDELLCLFSWRNGIGNSGAIPLGSLTLFPGFYFMSLEEGLQTYLQMKDEQDWQESWFPVFANGGGDFYLVDLNENKGCVIGYYLYEEEKLVEYTSLERLLATFAACFEQGIIFKDQAGFLDMDYLEHARIAHELNPDLPIWAEILRKES